MTSQVYAGRRKRGMPAAALKALALYRANKKGKGVYAGKRRCAKGVYAGKRRCAKGVYAGRRRRRGCGKVYIYSCKFGDLQINFIFFNLDI